jgi:hypothetical protein
MDAHYHWNVMHFSWPLAAVAVALTFVFFWLFFRKYGSEPGGAQLAGLTVLVSCPLMAFCAMALVSGLWQVWIDYRMARDGQVTTAVVRDRVIRTQPGTAESNPQDRTFMVFKFLDHAGRVWQVEREVEEGRPWSRLGRGDGAPAVQYLRSDPGTWRFADETSLWSDLLLTSGAVGVVIAGLRAACGLISRLISRCSRHRPRDGFFGTTAHASGRCR